MNPPKPTATADRRHTGQAIADESGMQLRPWGWYLVVYALDQVQIKRLGVEPGRRLSYQVHSHRREHWYVTAGCGIATVDGVETKVVPGCTVDVPQHSAHRLANTGRTDLVIVEVQTGAYLGEDDIERLADDYGRLG